MSYKFTLRDLPGGLEITGEAQDAKRLFEEVCFWQGLPSTCPIDGTDTVLYFKEPKGNSYYSIVSVGTPQYQFPLGQLKEGDGMFPKNQWTYWDGNVDVVIWEHGRMTPAGVAHIGKKSVQPTQNNVPQSPTPAASEWAAIPGVQKGVTSTEHTAQQAAMPARAASSGKFHAEVSSTFGGLDVDAARHWYVARWTNKHTPGSVRTSSSDLLESELVAMIAELKKYRAGIRDVFEKLPA